MNDLERVLSCLLHDLRSPLGVAGGYLRLMREGRLAGADETARAILKTQDALRAMTALCADATAWLDLEPPPAPRRYPAAGFLALVGAHAESQMVPLDLPVPGPAAALTLTGHDDAVARAVAVLMGIVSSTGDRRCAAVCGDTHLCFSVRESAPGELPAAAFDPWRYRGLAAPLAHRVIAEAGGRCASGVDAREPLRVEFTLDPVSLSPTSPAAH